MDMSMESTTGRCVFLDWGHTEYPIQLYLLNMHKIHCELPWNSNARIPMENFVEGCTGIGQRHKFLALDGVCMLLSKNNHRRTDADAPRDILGNSPLETLVLSMDSDNQVLLDVYNDHRLSMYPSDGSGFA